MAQQVLHLLLSFQMRSPISVHHFFLRQQRKAAHLDVLIGSCVINAQVVLLLVHVAFLAQHNQKSPLLEHLLRVRLKKQLR